MDKLSEWKQLRKILGSDVAATFASSESPDFIGRSALGKLVGVEVTSIFQSSSDAKLKKLPDYALGLLDKTQKVHRADNASLRVDPVQLISESGGVTAEIPAIVQFMPKFEDRVKLLFSTIASKAAKTQRYRTSCESVDLIVTDESSLFFHSTPEEFHKPFYYFAPKHCLLNSQFREIFLITHRAESREIYIPLIGNLFVADLLAFEEATLSLSRPLSDADALLLLAAALRERGYKGVRTRTNRDGTSLIHGAWELLYAQDGKNLRDWVTPREEYGGTALEDVLSDAPAWIVEHAQNFALNRDKVFSMIDVHFSTHTSDAV